MVIVDELVEQGNIRWMSTSPKMVKSPVGSDLKARKVVVLFHFDLRLARRWQWG